LKILDGVDRSSLPFLPKIEMNMNKFLNAVQATETLKEQGVVWLTLVDVIPDPDGHDVAIWECKSTLDMSEKGRSWKDAVLLESPNGIAVMEAAFSASPTAEVYFNNNQIEKK
jgi:hypothetical protein